MDLPDLVVRGSRVVTPAATGPASVHVRDGLIVEVAGYDQVPSRVRVVEAGPAVVLPGVVDTHVHVNEPGRTAWEGFSNATRAAAAGGVTTIVDMPLNSVPATTSLAALHAKRSAAAGKCHVDVGFWGGVVPGNLAELEPMAAAGVLGFKAFLVDSGVPEFAAVRTDELGAAMAALARLDALTIVHAEAPEVIAAAANSGDHGGGGGVGTARGEGGGGGDPRAYRSWLRSRPDRAETEAVTTVAELAQRLGARAHVLHLSSAEALEPLRRARAAGARISAETCPHYLTLVAEEVPDGATAYKCAPPIREAANSERLWAALVAGDLSLIASDHSPSPPDRKHIDDGDFMAAWGGISSLQLALPVVWTAARERGHSLADLAEWMSAAPARLVGLDGSKGAIAPGRDADLVLFDPDASFTVDPSALYHRHPVTPYAGLVLHGVVRATYLRGRMAWDGRRFADRPPGRLLAREAPG
jgi:allantoinase